MIPSSHYVLLCPVCRGHYSDDGIMLGCPLGCVSLLRTVYDPIQPPIDPSAIGLGRFHRRLPGDASRLTTPLPVLLHLPWLAERWGLPNLRVIFSGWWPKRGAFLPSGSFKDLEAAAVLTRLELNPRKRVVLASAGNTAAAFATACTMLGRHCVIIVAEEALARVRLPQIPGETVSIVAVTGGARYDDAIALSRAIVDTTHFVLEGGVRNIARRDGVGTALGVATAALGDLPDVYVQAVGSAAGAIAAFETAERERAAHLTQRRMRLALSQNAPFIPLVRSYERKSPVLLADDERIAREQIATIDAQVLSNMAPPYAIAGGIFDTLRASDGAMAAVTNADARRAAEEFASREGVALDPAAAVAVAGLGAFPREMLKSGNTVVLHLTGGRVLGERRFTVPFRATHRISCEDARKPDAVDRLREALLRTGGRI